MIDNKNIKALITLLLFGPFFGEAVSMSTPLSAFILPQVIIPLMMLYGLGLVIIHYLKTTKHLSTTSILLLGGVYGILEEGLSLKSFFNPNWKINELAIYGRVWGTNMVWSVSVTLYHVVVSIWVPLTLFEIFFPEYKYKPLLESKKSIVFAIILYFFSLLLFFIVWPYKVPTTPYLLTMIITVILFLLALKLHEDDFEKEKLTSSPLRIYFSGIAGFFLWVIFSWFMVESNIPWEVPFALMIGLPLFVVILSGGLNKYWDDKQKLVLITGIMTPMMILFPFLTETIPQAIVSIISIIILGRAFEHTKKRSDQNNIPS